MNDFAIIREGDEDRIELNNGDSINLGDIEEIPHSFVKRGKDKRTNVFVGIYTIPKINITIYSLPKYFPKEKCNLAHLQDVQSHIKMICEVVEKLRSEGKSFDDEEFLFDPYEQNVSNKKEFVNRFELAEYIIEDYLQYGIYVKDYTETRRGGVGRTNWGKTVARIQPIIQGKVPIYLDLMNRHHMIDENDLISVVHANVVNQCIDYLGPLISKGIEYIETEPLGENLSIYSSTINARSTYVFKEREINLFKALEAWCDCTLFYKNYAGVTCFDRVWEWVNDSVWGNIKSPESESPIYHIEGKEYVGSGEAIPDTIRIEENDDGKEVFIYDSKYYTINKIYPANGEIKINGFPANSDIVKQVAYLKLIKSQYRAKCFYNLFLLPESYEGCREEEKEAFQIPSKKWFTTIGYVKPGKFNLELDPSPDKEEKEEKVGLIFVNPEELYKKYLKGKKASCSELSETKNYLCCS